MRPLEDVRIIAIEQYGAGPFGTMHLADLGAEVIKIESPVGGGDVGRYVPPYAEGTDSLFFESFNRNKESLILDMSAPAGRRVFEDLVRVSDVVYSNLRGDVPQKIKITYPDLKHLNPAIVCCSLTGYGMTGPLRAQPAYDYMLQAVAGWMDITGEPDGPPTKSGLSLVDYSGGFVAAISVLAGVHAARRDGVGMDCDVSLYDAAISLLSYPATWHLTAGYEPKRTAHSAHPSLVPFQVFQASDGWLVTGGTKEKFWHRTLDVLGLPELADDPRYLTFRERRKNADTLLPIFIDVFATRTVKEWIGALEDAGVPCGEVLDVPAALAAEHTLARGLIVETDHPRYGVVRQLASPVRVGNEPISYRRAPQPNEHADQILNRLLAYDADTLAELTGNGAFGAVEPSSPSDPAEQ